MELPARTASSTRMPQLLLVTVGLVAATILFGVATKATGAGLACNASWPLCDGGVLNLFPETVPSFFEWFHRVVAMIAGFFIVGSAVAAWWFESIDRRITGLLVAGALLTPIQVLLGRETVLTYEMTILSLHFWTAIVIFTLFVTATVLVWRRSVNGRHLAGALVLAAASVPAHVLLSPVLIAQYTPVLQTLQYAVSLVLISALVLAVLVLPQRSVGRSATLAAGASGMVLVVLLVLGRRSVMSVTGGLEELYLASATVLLFTLIVTGWAQRRTGEPSSAVQT